MDIDWDVFFIPYKKAVQELQIKFMDLEAELSKEELYSPIEAIEGRVKEISSILRKADKKNIPISNIGDKIEDIAGVRIICRFASDIEKVASLIRKRDGIDMRIMRERDYIANPKPSGYRSYHILIKYPIAMPSGLTEVSAEIQIRTVVMNYWADIEHSMKYKINRSTPEHLQKRLISSAEIASQLDHEMESIKEDIIEFLRYGEL